MTRPPIALFVYNRLTHMRSTIEALQKNLGACESILYIFSDGPKCDADVEAVAVVRNYIKKIRGFADVIIVERNRNFGLTGSITTGVTEILGSYNQIVVLEDDIVTSPFFLTYMKEGLSKYANDERVMHVAGYMLPIDSMGLKETFFYRNTSCWGWGTWKHAWEKMEMDACSLQSKLTEEKKYRFNIDGAYDSWGILERQCKGEIDSWDIMWYASVFLSGGVCLHPSKSLTRNIGHDGSGIHCGTSEIYNVNVHEGLITEFEEIPIENDLALKRIKKYLLQQRVPSIKMVVKRLYKIVTGCL